MRFFSKKLTKFLEKCLQRVKKVVYYVFNKDFEHPDLISIRRTHMSLSWEKYWEIAEALNKAHPTQDLIHLNDENLLKMIVALPDFDDEPVPPSPKDLEAVLTCWTELDNPEAPEKIPASAL